jgi:hypothetical protein
MANRVRQNFRVGINGKTTCRVTETRAQRMTRAQRKEAAR